MRYGIDLAPARDAIMILPPDARRWPKAADLAGSVRVEIDCEVLARLMSGQPLGAADLHCLDSDSKRLLWRICLESCRLQACDDSLSLVCRRASRK